MTSNRRFTLIRRPHGAPAPADFAIDEIPVPPLADGEVLIRNVYCSLDPAIRGWLDEVPSYLPPIPLGGPVRSTTIAQVVDSRDPDFAAGDWVVGLHAIEAYSVTRAGGFLMKIDPYVTGSPTHHLSLLGAVGLTAYFGLLDVGRPKPGDTVLVTGAAGAVGSLVGQIAHNMGCRTIGIAGGAEKCRRLLEDYGFDAAIDYRGLSYAELGAKIGEAAPQGVDVIFENVGGIILDAGLLHMNHLGRVALCGLISEYNATDGAAGTRNLWQLIVKSATIAGFLIKDYVPRFGEGAMAMAGWLNDGKIRMDEHIVEGIDQAYPAFMMLFDGGNTGKLILKIGEM
jgi:NADPH-dependent curcumin reductase CurA